MYFLCEVIGDDLSYEVGSFIAFNRIKYDQFWVQNHRLLRVVEKQMGKSLHVWNDKYSPIWLDNEFAEEKDIAEPLIIEEPVVIEPKEVEEVVESEEIKEKEVLKDDTHETTESPSAVEPQTVGVKTYEIDEESGQDSSVEATSEKLKDLTEVDEIIDEVLKEKPKPKKRKKTTKKRVNK